MIKIDPLLWIDLVYAIPVAYCVAQARVNLAYHFASSVYCFRRRTRGQGFVFSGNFFVMFRRFFAVACFTNTLIHFIGILAVQWTGIIFALPLYSTELADVRVYFRLRQGRIPLGGRQCQWLDYRASPIIPCERFSGYHWPYLIYPLFQTTGYILRLRYAELWPNGPFPGCLGGVCFGHVARIAYSRQDVNRESKNKFGEARKMLKTKGI